MFCSHALCGASCCSPSLLPLRCVLRCARWVAARARWACFLEASVSAHLSRAAEHAPGSALLPQCALLAAIETRRLDNVRALLAHCVGGVALCNLGIRDIEDWVRAESLTVCWIRLHFLRSFFGTLSDAG